MPAPSDPIKYHEYIQKISKTHKGRKQSQEQIKNRVEARKLNGTYVSPLKGKKRPSRSEAHIQAMRIARSTQIIPFRDSKPERMIQLGLTLYGIKFQKHKSITDGKGFYHQVDIFIEPNICVEIDGDYWHANPRMYCQDYIIKTRKKNLVIVNAKDIWNRDTLVNNKLKQLGNHVIRIWVSDINKNPQKEVLGILQLIKKESV